MNVWTWTRGFLDVSMSGCVDGDGTWMLCGRGCVGVNLYHHCFRLSPLGLVGNGALSALTLCRRNRRRRPQSLTYLRVRRRGHILRAHTHTTPPTRHDRRHAGKNSAWTRQAATNPFPVQPHHSARGTFSSAFLSFSCFALAFSSCFLAARLKSRLLVPFACSCTFLSTTRSPFRSTEFALLKLLLLRILLLLCCCVDCPSSSARSLGKRSSGRRVCRRTTVTGTVEQVVEGGQHNHNGQIWRTMNHSKHTHATQKHSTQHTEHSTYGRYQRTHSTQHTSHMTQDTAHSTQHT